MAKQKGINPMTGTIDGFTFYYNKDHGFLVRRKGGPSRRQVKTSKAFDIPRRNNKEFGRANRYGKILRCGFVGLTCYCRESKMYSRLATRIREIMKMDKESTFGDRDLRSDNLCAFDHFEWDQWSLSSQYFELPVEAKVMDGCLDVTTGLSLRNKPQNADSWKVISIAVTVDFVKKVVRVDKKETDVYEYEKGDFADSFTHYIPNEGVLFHGLAIAWHKYDETIRMYRPLKEEHVNAAFIRFIDR